MLVSLQKIAAVVFQIGTKKSESRILLFCGLFVCTAKQNFILQISGNYKYIGICIVVILHPITILATILKYSYTLTFVDSNRIRVLIHTKILHVESLKTIRDFTKEDKNDMCLVRKILITGAY